MNNRLVKEYVRAICELQPTAFVMENVAMLKSQVHRFFLEENDMTNAKILNLPLREDNIEILPQNMNFEGSRELILSAPNGVQYAWAETFYKKITMSTCPTASFNSLSAARLVRAFLTLIGNIRR